MTDPSQVYDDHHFSIRTVSDCTVPGYLIVRPRREVASWADLTSDEAGALGLLIRAAIGAIESVTGADRVYTLVFAELDRRLHIHLFPRTPWLLDAYRAATGTHGQPPNGSALFEWARAVHVAGGPSIPDDKNEVERDLRLHLAARSNW